jgi:ankyrin repeat protein
VQLLLDKGADWAVASDDGWTPLNSALSQGYTEVVKMLLDKGADWIVANKGGWTLLYSASSQGHTEVVRLLLEANADMAMMTRMGKTPIHAAAFGGHSDVVQLLLRYGAEMRVLDIFGRPPFFYAIRAGDPTSFSVLKVPEFLEPEFQDVYGSNALSVAVRCGHEEMTRDLLSERSLMVVDRFGRTAVWWAHKQGYMHMVEHIAVHPDPAGFLNLSTKSPAKFAAEGGYCDVCLASLEGAYYACKICGAGSFAMCLVCFNIGARCLADDHTLTLSDG